MTIARALINKPAIVWADEPTGNLDSKGAQQILELMLKLNRENDQTFVVVTHDPMVGNTASRMIRMQDGGIVSEETKPHEMYSMRNSAVVVEDARALRARRLAFQARSTNASV